MLTGAVLISVAYTWDDSQVACYNIGTIANQYTGRPICMLGPIISILIVKVS